MMQAKPEEPMMPSRPHATLEKFGYPASLLHEGAHWAVLVRPMQPTLGSLVLCATGEERSYGDLPPAAFAEQGLLVARIEAMLRRFVDHEKINYLMLMMVDPHVHFHVVPRYSGERAFEGALFADSGWPALPALGDARPSSPALVDRLGREWRESA